MKPLSILEQAVPSSAIFVLLACEGSSFRLTRQRKRFRFLDFWVLLADRNFKAAWSEVFAEICLLFVSHPFSLILKALMMGIAIVESTVVTTLQRLVAFLAMVIAIGFAFKAILGLTRPTNNDVRGTHKNMYRCNCNFPVIGRCYV